MNRLDKVLSKFVAIPLDDNSGTEYKYTNEYGMSIHYLFGFELFYKISDNNYQFLEDLSLETVEYILKDIENDFKYLSTKENN